MSKGLLKIILILFTVCIAIVAIYQLISNLFRPSLNAFDIDSKLSTPSVATHTLPKTRSFKMGFTNQPFDWNEPAFHKTIELIQRHADTLTIFSDVGIPWVEAYEGRPYSPAIEADLKRQQAFAQDFKHVIVMTSFLGSDRASLSAYAHGETGMAELPGSWANLTFNDPKVVTAYLNYCRDLIERFEPDYFGYVAEVDTVFTDVTETRFINLRDMSKKVYTTLKAEYPDLPIFAEFILGDEPFMEARKQVIRELLPYTDLYALSTYPAHYDSIAGDASKIPANWFIKAKDYAQGKPMAIMESAFLAEPFMHPTQGIKVSGQSKRLLIPGGKKSQAIYIKQLLEAAGEMDMVFVNLWAVHDLDALFALLEQGDGIFAHPMGALAKDTGLYDQDGKPRPALQLWDAWYRIPLQSNDNKES